MIIVSFVFMFSSCYKEANFEDQTFLFMRGVILNNAYPLIRITENSLAGEKSLNFSEYDVKVKSDKGEEEFMLNGKFSQIKCQIGVEYTVLWKLKTETNWRSIVKKIPYPDTINISNSKLSQLANGYFFNNVKLVSDDMFFWAESDESLNDNNTTFQSVNGVRLWSSALDNFMFINPSISGNLQVYPAKSWCDWCIPYQPCTQPFNWFPVNRLKNLTLIQSSSKDIEIMKQITQNSLLSDQPLYSGEPIKWDYNDKRNFGHIFSYYKYDNIKLINIPKKEEIVTYSLLMNGLQIDTNKISVEAVSFSFDENIANTSQSADKVNQLFFKDYIASSYNTLFDKPCGYYHPNYKFKVRVTYLNKPKTKPVKYQLYSPDTTYTYSYKSSNIIIDIK